MDPWIKSNRTQPTYRLACRCASLVFDSTIGLLPSDFVRDHKEKPSNSSMSLTSKQSRLRPSGLAGAVPVGRCLMPAGQRVSVLKFAFSDSRAARIAIRFKASHWVSVVISGLDWRGLKWAKIPSTFSFFLQQMLA